MSDTLVCIVDGNRGIYIPQTFLQSLAHEDIDALVDAERFTRADVDAVLAGPEHPDYWEAWTSIVDGFRQEDDERKVWTLHEDGDLYLVREDHRWNDARYSVHLTDADGTRCAFECGSTAELVDELRTDLEWNLDAPLEDAIARLTFSDADGKTYPSHDADALTSYSPQSIADLLNELGRETRLHLEVIVL